MIVLYYQNFIKFPFTKLIYFVAVEQIYVNWIHSIFLAFSNKNAFNKKGKSKIIKYLKKLEREQNKNKINKSTSELLNKANSQPFEANWQN